MATAKQFLEAIERQKLVSDDVLDRLYELYRDSGGAVTAEALASRLVAAGSLPQSTVTALLQAPSDSFIQVGSGIFDPKPKSVPVVDDPFETELKTKRTKGGVERDAAGRRKHVKKTHKNDFDSPLLMIGAGALALLLLGGLGLTVAMNLQSGDQVLKSAEEAYAAGSYAKAYEDYAKYVEDYAGSTRWSEARVKLAVVRLRQLTETARDWDGALAMAQQELPQVEDEPAFIEHRGEFASILPRVARGLAEQADKESAAGSDVAKLVEQAKSALGLVENTKYVPKSLRDERELAEVNELLGRVARRSEAVSDLTQSLATIEGATASGEIAKAYSEWSSFIERRPELRDSAELAEKLAAAVEAERQVVRFEASAAEATAEEPPTAVLAALPLIDRRREGQTSANGLYLLNHGSVLYAVNAADGTLAWRRPVGTSLSDTPPTAVDGDLLLIDHRRGELVRVEAANGALVWRTPLGDFEGAQWFAPAVSADTVLVASSSGRVAAFEAATGARRGYVTFAQPLRSAVAVDASRGKAYVAGEQSSLYTIDTRSLECVGVRYTGHGPGTVVVPPVTVGDRVLLVDNAGAKKARLRVYDTDESGVVSQQLSDWQLDGIVSSPAVVEGRRVLLTTESGAAYLFDATAAMDGPPVTLVASRGGTNGPPRRYTAALAGGDVWIASEGLERTAASLADSQLISRDLAGACEGDLFVGRPEGRGDALLHTRLRKDRPGVTVAASDAKSGELVWETDLGAAPLGPPRFDDGVRGVVATLADGSTHLIGPAQVRAKLSQTPAAKPTRAELYEDAMTLPAARVCAKRGAAEWLAVAIGARSSARSVALPDTLAAPPAAMGEGALAPFRIGQVLLLSAAGQPLATPYQPRLAVGQQVSWTPPVAAQVGSRALAVLTDGAATATCLELTTGDEAALEARGSLALPAAPADVAAAIAGENVAILLKSGDLLVAALPSLERRGEVKLPAPVVWGPYAAGELALVATEGELIALRLAGEPAVAWRFELAGDAPVGAPLMTEDTVVVALRDGGLTRRALADGSEAARIAVGERLGSGPTAYGPRLLVATADGAVLVVGQP